MLKELIDKLTIKDKNHISKIIKAKIDKVFNIKSIIKVIN